MQLPLVGSILSSENPPFQGWMTKGGDIPSRNGRKKKSILRWGEEPLEGYRECSVGELRGILRRKSQPAEG